MANAVSIQKIEEGPRNAIFKVDVALDGSGDYSIPQTIVDAKLLATPRLRVDRLEWSVQDGMTINLLWDGAGSSPMWRMTGRGREDAKRIGGLQNNADQPSGKITMTTSSQQSGLPLSASFTIHCTKKTL